MTETRHRSYREVYLYSDTCRWSPPEMNLSVIVSPGYPVTLVFTYAIFSNCTSVMRQLEYEHENTGLNEIEK